MVEEQQREDYDLFSYNSIRIKNLEEKQEILKDRLLLIGKNFLETKEITNDKMIEIKRDINDMKQDIERIKSFLESISSEITKFAKKEDLDILAKQAKMFQPLEFVRKSELKNKKKK
jgi:signal transduction protein with GAF and PtsI domain|tara:strand:+ start:2484 stop:2834 length:351 start_codon:yes stop_codon:yes gene_type:complete